MLSVHAFMKMMGAGGCISAVNNYVAIKTILSSGSLNNCLHQLIIHVFKSSISFSFVRYSNEVGRYPTYVVCIVANHLALCLVV